MTLWICYIKASRVGGSDRISELSRSLEIWYLAISTDHDISGTVAYNESANHSITFKFSSASGKVGRLLYSRNVLETTEFISHASQNLTFLTWQKLEVQSQPERECKSNNSLNFFSSICAAIAFTDMQLHDGDSHIAINFQEIRHICNQNYNNICSQVNIF